MFHMCAAIYGFIIPTVMGGRENDDAHFLQTPHVALACAHFSICTIHALSHEYQVN